MTAHPFDAAAFDGYRLTASPNGVGVDLTCHHCPPDLILGDFDPSPSNVLAVVQTVRNHNLTCPSRRPKPHPPTIGPVEAR